MTSEFFKSIVQLEHCLMDSRLSTSYWNCNKKKLQKFWQLGRIQCMFLAHFKAFWAIPTFSGLAHYGSQPLGLDWWPIWQGKPLQCDPETQAAVSLSWSVGSQALVAPSTSKGRAPITCMEVRQNPAPPMGSLKICVVGEKTSPEKVSTGYNWIYWILVMTGWRQDHTDILQSQQFNTILLVWVH